MWYDNANNRRQKKKQAIYKRRRMKDMKSNTCYLYGNTGRDKVLREAEKTAQYCELGQTHGLQLRLLAEELLGMVGSLTGSYKGLFWIEAEDDVNFQLHLQIKKPENTMSGRRVSQTAFKNATGLMDRLKNVFENCLERYGDLDEYDLQEGLEGGLIINLDNLAAGFTAQKDSIAWSLRAFEAAMPKASPEWDELEKSIILSLADDIIVNIKKGRADMVIYKNFSA